MRIGVVGHPEPDMFGANVIDAVRDAGHVAVPLGPARPGRAVAVITRRLAHSSLQALPRLDKRLQWRIVRAAADASCELVISVDARLMPEAVAALRRNGARVALWFPDALINLGRAHMLLAPYDAFFFKEPHLVERLRAMLDLPVYYLPEGCNPRCHRPVAPAGTEPYLVIAGNMYPSRVRVLERLTAKGIPVRAYGGAVPRWIGDSPVRDIHTGRLIFTEEKARVFRSAAGVLNNLHPGEIEGVNARLFEAAGSGAAVLTEFRPTLPDLFRPGEEVLAFRDFSELVEQASRLLNEPGLTASLGDAAARRAHRDHTIAQRIATIIEKVT
ncbi:MAG: CgeB family protein [Streptosporangiaceae bacterium]